MYLAGVACGQDSELWVAVEVCNDGDELLLDSKPSEGCGDGLWVGFVKGLPPVKEEEVEGVP